MLRFDWGNVVGKMRIRYRRQSKFLALALTSFVLAGAAQPAQAQYIQQGQKLIGTNGSTDALQGYSVALSADGNTALVGGPYDNGQAGAVWFYTRTGGVWSQQGSKLTVTDNVSNARFGWAVALSADGNTALIGGPADNTTFGGAAWVFTSEAARDRFGQIFWGPGIARHVGCAVCRRQHRRGGCASRRKPHWWPRRRGGGLHPRLRRVGRATADSRKRQRGSSSRRTRHFGCAVRRRQYRSGGSPRLQ
jgi:hypothetical protein